MYKWKYLTITAIMALFSCQGGGGMKSEKQSAKQQVDYHRELTDTSGKMQMTLRPDTFRQKDTTKMFHYTITNNFEKELIISSSFVIEKLVEKKWEMVPISEMLVVEDITYAVPAKGSKEYALALSRVMKDHGSKKGHYRFVKEAWIYGEESTKSRLTAEFEIR